MKSRKCAICGDLIPFNSGAFVWYSQSDRYVCKKCLELKER
jgi:hypothetical protein